VAPAAILLGGLAGASLFRNPGAAPGGGPEPHEVVIYRRLDPAAETGALLSDRRPGRTEPWPAGPSVFAAAAPAATVLTAETESPPTLGKSFPQDQPTSRWGTSMGIGLPGPGASQPRTHKIADGDTLPGLAQLYLGDAGRYQEIFQANRDVLPSPDVLPIGRELKIPPRRPAP
jgi:nucleoid-associated protein YgaU